MLAAAAAGAAVAGCGSASVEELPPPAVAARAPALTVAPAGRIERGAKAERSSALGGRAWRTAGGALAVLAARARTLELRDPRTGRRLARVAAGVGPTHVVGVSDRLYVTDTRGGALLVFATRPELALVRRVFLPGGPYAIALDPVRHRLWVTLTARNEVVSLPANGRPRPLVRLPTVRQPDGVAVDPARGTVTVTGVGGAAPLRQLIDARRAYPADEG